MKLFASPLTYIVLLGLTGMVSIIVGVQLLAGTGWAAIAGGLMSIVLALLISRGLNNG